MNNYSTCSTDSARIGKFLACSKTVRSLGANQTMSVIVNWIDRAWKRSSARRGFDRSFPQVPPIVGSAVEARRLKIDFLPRVLAYVCDEEISRLSVETVPVRISQPVGPNFRGVAACGHEGIVCRDRVGRSGPRRIHTNPQNLSEQRIGLLGVAVRIVTASPSPVAI